jgi:acetolactate synthase-1/2/3 large subunit
MIAAAEHPVIITEYTGRDHEAFHTLVELAETAGIPVYDINSRLSFPSRHPLNVSLSKDAFREADLVVCLDARDWEKPTTGAREHHARADLGGAAGAKWVEIGFGDLELSSWALDYQRMNHADLRVMADTTLAIPMLTTLLKARIEKDRKLAAKVKARIAATAAQTKARRAKWAEQARQDWDAEPDHAAAPRLRGLERDQGRGLGAHRRDARGVDRASCGISTSPTAPGALARHLDADRHLHRRGARQPRAPAPGGGHAARRRPHVRRGRAVDRGQAPHPDAGRDVQQPRVLQRLGAPDPHGEAARHAGRRAHIGMDMTDSDPDFGKLAQSMGWYGEGPIDDPKKVAAALKRAIAKVKSGQPALLDTLTLKTMTTAAKRIGMIGAGRMGQPMIGHLARKGFEVSAYDIDAGKRSVVEGKGGRWQPDLPALAKSSEVVLVCVGFDRELRELLAPGRRAARPGEGIARGGALDRAPATMVELGGRGRARRATWSTPPSAAAARAPTRARCSPSSAATRRVSRA